MQHKIYVHSFIYLFLISILPFSLINTSDPIPWIGSCNPDGYSEDHYMAYCNDLKYGNYEHWAIWKGIEPTEIRDLKKAQTLFFGSSMMQYAFSTQSVRDHFKKLGVTHYLLGFGHNEGNYFSKKLVDKWNLRPQLIVISINSTTTSTPFFGGSLYVSAEAKRIMEESASTKFKYTLKHYQQELQKTICFENKQRGLVVSFLCGGDANTGYRSRRDGHWLSKYHTHNNKNISVTYYKNKDTNSHLDLEQKNAESFFSGIGVPRECIVLTVTPKKNTKIHIGRELGDLLGVPVILLEIPDLKTVDGAHLNEESSEKFSLLFMEKLTPYIQKCVDNN